MDSEIQSSGPVDADCGSCCDQILPQVKVYVRSFHPNAVFNETEHLLGRSMGGPWSGDGRGFSTDTSTGTTSRVMHSYTINLQAVDAELNGVPSDRNFFTTSIRPQALSDPSHGVGFDIVGTYPAQISRFVDMPRTSPYGPLYEVNGPQSHPDMRINTRGIVLLTKTVPEAKLVRRDVLLNQRCHKSVTVITHHFGVNTAVPMSHDMAGAFVPDLDVFAKINFDIDKSQGVLGIDAAVFGDQFPNCEAFVEDARGTKVFLGASVRIGYPVNAWGGSTLRGVQTLPMFSSDLEIKLDSLGEFESFSSGSSFSEWNRTISELDPNGKSNPTTFRKK